MKLKHSNSSRAFKLKNSKFESFKALSNRANMLANIWTNIVGQYFCQHVGAVCYRHQYVGEEKKCRKMLANIC